MSFTSGADAEWLGLLSDQDRRRTALAETTKVWPEAPKYWEGAVVKYWNEDRWIRGSYLFRGVGQKDSVLSLANPRPRLFRRRAHRSVVDERCHRFGRPHPDLIQKAASTS